MRQTYLEEERAWQRGAMYRKKAEAKKRAVAKAHARPFHPPLPIGELAWATAALSPRSPLSPQPSPRSPRPVALPAQPALRGATVTQPDWVRQTQGAAKYVNPPFRVGRLQGVRVPAPFPTYSPHSPRSVTTAPAAMSSPPKRGWDEGWADGLIFGLPSGGGGNLWKCAAAGPFPFKQSPLARTL